MSTMFEKAMDGPDFHAVSEDREDPHVLRQRTAHHEAGHAVTLIVDGRRIAFVELGTPGNGFTQPVPSGENWFELMERDPAKAEMHIPSCISFGWLAGRSKVPRSYRFGSSA